MTTILVVDDNDSIATALADYLRGSGYLAVTAPDGPSALAAVAKQRPDLALLDIMLPGIDGLELTRRFQAENIPVILVTARADEVDRLVGLELGADDYITKPFSPREVLARVKTVLRRCERQHSGTSVLTVGDLSIDRDRHEIRIGGNAVDLTHTEFDILAMLAAHSGRVYTRAQLLDAAAGDAFEGYERTIDAHVKNIRKKLGDDPRHPRYIRTIIGVGYKLEA